MTSTGSTEITHLLKAWREGDHTALEQLAPEVYEQLRRELIAVDDALEALARMDPRKTRVIELRFFGGLSVEDTAAVLRISPQSVMRDRKLAKVWLARELGKAASD